MEDKDEKLVRDFLTKNKNEIADKGFSAKVIEKTPFISNQEWIIGLFSYIGITLALLISVLTGFLEKFIVFFFHLPVIYLTGIMFLIPFVIGLILILLKGTNRLRII